MFRITAYSNRLIRFQYHPQGSFDDRPSFFAQHREHGRELTADADGVYRTDAVEIRVNGDGPFTAENTEVKFPMGTWRPGMTPLGALGGTTRTLDGTAGDPPTSPGYLSRDGWAVVDDSGTVRFASRDPAPPAPADTAIGAPVTRHSSLVLAIPGGRISICFFMATTSRGRLRM